MANVQKNQGGLGQMNQQDQHQQLEDQSSKELNDFVQQLLEQMQNRFEEMSTNIVGRIDEMGNRIDAIEKSITELMDDIGLDEQEIQKEQIQK